MGYRVGNQCLADQSAADDYILSALPPTITAEGTVIRPYRQSEGWYLNGQKIQLSYPACNPLEHIQQGAQIGSAFIALVVIAFGIRQIIRFIGSLNGVGSGED